MNPYEIVHTVHIKNGNTFAETKKPQLVEQTFSDPAVEMYRTSLYYRDGALKILKDMNGIRHEDDTLRRSLQATHNFVDENNVQEQFHLNPFQLNLYRYCLLF